MAKKVKAAFTGKQALELRKKLGLNQLTFWSKVGVTQSGGSRYESGRTVPRPVQGLLVLAYGDKEDESLAALRSGTFFGSP